jgi:hypothetical protein
MRKPFDNLSEFQVTLWILAAAAIAAVLMLGHLLWKRVSLHYANRS